MSILARSPHAVIWRGLHKVKAIVIRPIPIYSRRIYTRHLCSGWAPFVSWQRASHTLNLVTETTSEWYHWMLHNYGYLLGHGGPFGSIAGDIPVFDYRGQERYLVSTYVATVSSTDGDVVGTPLAAGIKLRHILKLHKHDNATCWQDWAESHDNGATWLTGTGPDSAYGNVYHWEVNDTTGAVLESSYDGRMGSDLRAGLCGWVEDWLLDLMNSNGWLPTAPPYVNFTTEGSVTVTVSGDGTGISLGLSRRYSIDGGSTFFRNISIGIDLALSNESTWNVSEAQAECKSLSDAVDLGNGVTYYPPGTGLGTGTMFDSGDLTIEWKRATTGPDAGKMLKTYTFSGAISECDDGQSGFVPLWDPPEGSYPDKTDDIPPIRHVMRVAANLLNIPPVSGFDPLCGSATMIKTVVLLNPNSYTVRVRDLVPFQASNNLPTGVPPDVGDGLYPLAPPWFEYPWTHKPESGSSAAYVSGGSDVWLVYAKQTLVSYNVPTALSAKEIRVSPIEALILPIDQDMNPIDTHP